MDPFPSGRIHAEGRSSGVARIINKSRRGTNRFPDHAIPAGSARIHAARRRRGVAGGRVFHPGCLSAQSSAPTGEADNRTAHGVFLARGFRPTPRWIAARILRQPPISSRADRIPKGVVRDIAIRIRPAEESDRSHCFRIRMACAFPWKTEWDAGKPPVAFSGLQDGGNLQFLRRRGFE